VRCAFGVTSARRGAPPVIEFEARTRGCGMARSAPSGVAVAA
jgi:hypothetical protein